MLFIRLTCHMIDSTCEIYESSVAHDGSSSQFRVCCELRGSPDSAPPNLLLTLGV